MKMAFFLLGARCGRLAVRVDARDLNPALELAPTSGGSPHRVGQPAATGGCTVRVGRRGRAVADAASMLPESHPVEFVGVHHPRLSAASKFSLRCESPEQV